MLTASRKWHCHCGCGGTIEPGEKFNIKAGDFLKEGHDRTPGLEIIKLPEDVINKRSAADARAEQLNLFQGGNYAGM